jgi:hypothetical protein
MIDFRDHDTHEQGLTQTQRVTEITSDLNLAQRVRDSMRSQGMRLPLTADEIAAQDAKEFAEANARMGVKP